jgi:hypothetical protein
VTNWQGLNWQGMWQMKGYLSVIVWGNVIFIVLKYSPAFHKKYWPLSGSRSKFTFSFTILDSERE